MDCILLFGRWIKGLLVIAMLVQSFAVSIHASMAFTVDDTSFQHEVSHNVELNRTGFPGGILFQELGSDIIVF
jgi:hypothetical protein